MSERYGACPRCRGVGVIRDSILLTIIPCSRCDGDGFDGSADAWMIKEQKIDHQKDRIEHIGTWEKEKTL